MFKKALIGCVSIVILIVLLFVVIGVTMPNDYSIERSITVNADAETVFAYIGDLQKWEEWGPWHESDPTIKTTYSEETAGVGASQTWTGDSGGGRLSFTAWEKDKRVDYEMVFVEGDTETPATGAVFIEESGEGVEVTWTMESDITMPVLGGYVAKIIVPYLDAMFDKGLERLKKLAEAEKEDE